MGYPARTYYAVIIVLFMAAKKFITVPRIGLVKFGKERKKSMNKLILILVISVLFGLVMVLITKSGMLSGIIEFPVGLISNGSYVFVVPSGIMVITGTVLLIRFMREYSVEKANQ